ncbi:MAG TPA: DUF4349 domain-containing protein [Gemmatimonadaceae bacterium]
MKASLSFLTVALASLAFGCDKPATPVADAVSEQRSGFASEAPARGVGALQGKVAGAAVQFGDAPVTTAVASEPRSDAPPATPNPLQTIYPGPATGAMVIRTGEAFIEVDKVDPAVLKIRQLAAQVGGYIANSSISGGHDQIRQATIELKIPATKYEEAVGSLSTIGKVETVNSTAQDVGEEFVDVTARVNNSRRLEERLISLLANRTGKLDEVLRVERELARVREEIERYEGRLRYLSARVAMSTLTITVHEPAPILGNSPGENPIAAAFRRAWKNFVGVVAASIAALGVLIPLAILALLGWAGYRRWKGRAR